MNHLDSNFNAFDHKDGDQNNDDCCNQDTNKDTQCHIHVALSNDSGSIEKPNSLVNTDSKCIDIDSARSSGAAFKGSIARIVVKVENNSGSNRYNINQQHTPPNKDTNKELGNKEPEDRNGDGGKAAYNQQGPRSVNIRNSDL